MTLTQATAAVADPATRGTTLQAIAAKHRSLWADIANHPNAYPDLLDWLAEVGDTEVQAIVDARLNEVADTDPDLTSPVMHKSNFADQSVDDTLPAHPGHNRSTIIIGVVVAVSLIAVAVLLVWLFRDGQAPSGESPVTVTVTQTTQPSDTATVASPTIVNPLLDSDPSVAEVIQPLSLPTLPVLSTSKVQVQTDGFDRAAIQKLADDVAVGDVEKIVRSCWTQPASELRLIYGSASMRGAILQALTTYPTSAQGGVVWEGEYVTVSAFWEEVDSRYTCVMIDWGVSGGLGSFTPAMAQWRITRILGVYDGTPVHTGDGTNYMLLCDDECGPAWAPHDSGDLYNPSGRVPILRADATQWEQLRRLSQAQIVVERLSNDYYRVRAVDGSTGALAYFTGDYNDFWLPYLLGEVA